MRGSSQQMPGFAVAGEAMRAGVGGQEKMVAGGDGADGNDEPCVFGNDASNEEINFVTAVRAGALVLKLGGRGAELVSAVMSEDPRRFHLNAAEAAAGVHDEVVPGAVAERLGDGEAEVHGAGEKARFGEFATGFGGRHTPGALVGGANGLEHSS